MPVSITYSYKVEAMFVLDGKEEPILSEGINYIITNYDYDNNNIPVIYMGLNLEASLYNKMVSNSERGTVTLTISKRKNESNFPIFTNYIKESFIYNMPTDPDCNETIEKESGTKDQIGYNYKQGYISLIKLQTIDNNKINTNTIIRDSNMSSIIHKYTSHMNMVMEPLHNDKKFKLLIIKPMESNSQLLKFLNQQSVFYRGGYRYFVDFNETYLLSGEGNPVQSKDNLYSTIIINVNDTTVHEARQTGVIIDHINKAYVLNVNVNNTVVDVNKTEDKHFNRIMAVDSYGNTSEVDLNIPKTQGSTSKIRIERVPSDNMEYVNYLKDNIENATLLFSVTKTEVDASLITPNKEYIVRNYPNLSEYNGRYVLSYKKDVFSNQGDTFINSVLFGLRKVKDR